jgi:uncharacterized membrane protein YfhO
MRKLKDIVCILAMAIATTLLVYWKIPVKGLIPFPGNLLVGRFFPFNTMDWEGYPLGVPYKEFINADVVRQLYPWRDLAIQLIKKGEVPWWNPYTFSGNPLLANVQSAPFYPLNFLYWITSHKNAWVLQVLLQPILTFTFMWLFSRELKLSKSAAFIASIAFAFCGYMVIFWQLNTVGQAALWLPLVLWGIERLRKTKKLLYSIPIVFGQTASLLAGHLQTSLYVFAVSIAYFFLESKAQWKKNQTLIARFLLAVALSFIIALPQLLPAIRFIPLTARGTQIDKEIFNHFILPVRQLITFFAHDYYGNPAADNFWGIDYGEFMGFFGVVALFFAAIAVSNKKTEKEKIFVVIALTALLFALPTPLPHLLRILKIPILSNSAPSRTLFIVQFCGSLLAGFGVDKWLKHKKTKIKFTVFLFTAVFLAAWLLAAIGFNKALDPGQAANWKVTLRNLILPTAVFIVTATLLATGNIINFTKKLRSYNLPARLDSAKRAGKVGLKVRKLSLIVILSIALVEYSYFANKFQTFSESRFFFPETPIYEFLSAKSETSPDRFFGDYTASVTSNSWMPYQVYGVEGYDSLYIKRFGELLAASEDGILPESVPRSDANLIKNQDDTKRRRLQDLMGVKYILDKNDNPQSDWEPDPHRFPPERYQLLWQQGKFKVYENTQSLPRAFLASEYTVETDSQTILNLIFNPDFNLARNIIFEKEITSELTPSQGKVKFIKYTPNTVELKVETQTTQLLFLSDVYYPDWIATVDEKEVEIYRANYAFRAIVVPPGIHAVEFSYKPKLF